MSNITVPYSEVGKASFEKLDNYIQSFLLAGDEPELISYPFSVAKSQTIAKWQVVGLDASGNLVPAVYNADAASAIQAIGVATQAITTGTSNTLSSIPIYFSGCFNGNALVYDSSYSTEALKKNAFRGAPTPTTITVKFRPLGTPGT